MARTSTMPTTRPAPRRAVLTVDADERVIVTACEGTGPYTLTVRQVTWRDRLRWRLAARVRRITGPITRRTKAWQDSRCDESGCWRKADPDTDENFYCQRHGGIARSADEAI
jgi:hypothetical protein